MFLKATEMKKIMKDAFKRQGLVVGNVYGKLLVCAGESWAAEIEEGFVNNKFKAAVIEIIGDLPDPGECYRYYVADPVRGMELEMILSCPDLYREWAWAKDHAIATPIVLTDLNHDYSLYQCRSDSSFVAVNKALTNAISARDLEEGETMPDRPAVNGGVLYFKNDHMIYRISPVNMPEKVRNVLFRSMDGIDFFKDDWTRERDTAKDELQY